MASTNQNDGVKDSFGAWDIVVFTIMLLISAFFGIFYAIKDRKKKTTENYYFGNRKLSPIPLGLSMAVSFISAITIIGTPVEVYMYGAVIAWVCIGNVFASIFAAVYYIPLIHKLKLASIYEYLEMRFNRPVRLVCSTITALMMVLYMGFSVYIPSLALSAVTPIHINVSIALTAIVCTFYTTLGGIKAVIWTDTVQAVIMLVGSIVLLIKATVMSGGPDVVWNTVVEGGRMNIFKMSTDVTIRSTMWWVLIGQTIMQSAGTCSNQAMAQRFLACESVSAARKALLAYLIPASMIFLTAVANGCVLYTFFAGCDPMESGVITKNDQATLYMMMKTFRDMPGFSGLFVAAVCSGTLSTVSTGINSVSVMLLHDYILPWKPRLCMRTKMIISWACALIFGTLVMLIAYGTGLMGTNIIKTATSVLGAFGGPIFGAFLLGMFLPWTSSKGCMIGIILGASFNIWMIIGAMLYPLLPEKGQRLNLKTDQCSFNSTESSHTYAVLQNYTSTTFAMNFSTPAMEPERPMIADTLYSISFFLYGLIGTSVTVLCGIIASFIIGANDPTESNPELFMPLLSNEVFPEKVRQFFRFGVPENTFEKEPLELKASTETTENLIKETDDIPGRV